MNLNERINQLIAENERLKAELETANSMQVDAVAERDALAAHCIRLKGFMQSCADSHLEDGEQEAADMYLNQVNLTPDYCLAAHDAEVAAKAVLEFAATLLANEKIDVIDFAKYQANQLRAKAGA